MELLVAFLQAFASVSSLPYKQCGDLEACDVIAVAGQFLLVFSDATALQSLVWAHSGVE